MSESELTRPSLLLQIRDQRNGTAWAHFVDIYAPLIYRYARKHGLQDADAADMTQDVLQAVAKVARRFDYDREKGSFRGWLLGVARNKLCDSLARNDRRVQATGGTTVQGILEQQTDCDDDHDFWDHEYEQCLFAYASDQIRREVHDSTWQAFWQTAVEGKRGPEVAAELGLSTAAVYLAKSRVMARLKEKVREMDDD